MTQIFKHNKCITSGNFLIIFVIFISFLALAGCVELEIGEDRTVYLGSQVEINSLCIPTDTGNYTYQWTCKKKPESSTIPETFSTDSSQLSFTPDVLGEYKIQCNVFAGLEGLDTASVVITCIDSTWTIDTTLLDFGDDTSDTEMSAVFTNTGVVPLILSIDRDSMSTPEWVTDIYPTSSTVLPDESVDIAVTIDQEQCNDALRTYFNLNVQKEGSDEIIATIRIIIDC